MCPSEIQSKSDSMNENSWLGLMYMPMWKTDEIRLNKLELRLRSNVYIQAECRTNQTQRMRLAVEVRCISKGDDIKIKRKVSPFFLSPLAGLPFIAILSKFFSFHMLKAAIRSSEIKMKYG